MRDWHQESDTALANLHEHHASPCYQSMVAWFEAMYEREKEQITLCDTPEVVQYHWLQSKGLRELLNLVKIEPD